MYGKQLHPHCMNVFTQLNTKCTRAGGLITEMAYLSLPRLTHSVLYSAIS